MATIFKPTYSMVVPDDAEIIVRKGKRHVRFKGKDGRTIIAPAVEKRRNQFDDRERCLMKADCWYFKFQIGTEQVKRKGFTDKEATRQLASRIKREMSFEKATGQRDRFKEHRKRPLQEHFTDFVAFLRDKENSEEYVSSTESRIRRVLESCGFVYMADVSPSRVQSLLAELREEGCNATTINHYLRAAKMFTRWLVRDRRTDDDPLVGMSQMNAESDRRRTRRPLSSEEIDWLLRAAAAGPAFQNVSGTDRVMLYIVAAYTGYRRNELASVGPSAFRFETEPPTLTVEAGNTKHRRLDVIPLKRDIATLIQEWIKARGFQSNSCLFPVKGKRTAEMLSKDLELAREAWLADAKTTNEREEREESNFLRYVDGNGCFADFHALRTTYITNLSRAGVSPQLAQTLARHSDINLTMNVYTHLALHDQGSAVERLPSVCSPNAHREASERLKAAGPDTMPLVPELVQAPDSSRLAGSPTGTKHASNRVNDVPKSDEANRPLILDFGSLNCLLSSFATGDSMRSMPTWPGGGMADAQDLKS